MSKLKQFFCRHRNKQSPTISKVVIGSKAVEAKSHICPRCNKTWIDNRFDPKGTGK
jgi:hypothetical protein